MKRPTEEQFSQYQAMFDHFNEALFGGLLPPALLNFSRDVKRANGYFAASRWASGAAEAHEITLNPGQLVRGPEATAATLVHEMVHLWQHVFGKPSRTGYHNAQWAEKMEAVGLMPSHTGQVGGRRVGQRVTHYIINGGAFKNALTKLQHALPWHSGNAARATGKYDKRKQKYMCAQCGMSVWGKPGLSIGCLTCNVALTESVGPLAISG